MEPSPSTAPTSGRSRRSARSCSSPAMSPRQRSISIAQELDLAAITALIARRRDRGPLYRRAVRRPFSRGSPSACARGLRRWAALVLATAALSSLFIAASILLQAPNWANEFDHSWIDLPGLRRWASLARSPSPPSARTLCRFRLSMGPGIARSRATTRNAASWRSFGIVLVVGVAIILAVHACQADRGRSLPLRGPGAGQCPARRAGGAAGAASHPVRPVGARRGGGRGRPAGPTGIRPLWSESAGRSRRSWPACPTTQVYAASGWALGPAAETRAARREDPVFARAYRMLADAMGLHGPVHRPARTARTRHPAPARCCSGSSTRPTRPRTICRRPSRRPA